MSSFLKKTILILYRIMMVIIIVSLLLADKIPYSDFHKRSFIAPNFILLPIGVALVLGIKHLAGKQVFDRIKPWMLFAVMFILSALVAFSSMYMTGWDAGTVVGDALSLSQNGSINPNYYSGYPNNRLILVIITSIFKLGLILGLSGNAALYGFAVLFQCIIFNITGIMVYDYLRITQGKRAATFGTIIYTLFIATSPWVFIVYTDSLGIIFPVLILWLSVKIPGDRIFLNLIKWILIIISAVCGYYIKAPAFIMLIAMILAYAVDITAHLGQKRFLTDILTLCVILVVSFLVIRIGDTLVEKPFENITGVQRNEEMEITAYHYLMMGHNIDSCGTFNQEDLQISEYISDYNERISVNKSEIKKRVKELWPFDLFYLYIRKTTMNYNDGTFGYGLTDEDFISDPLTEDIALDYLERFFYRPGHKGFSYMVDRFQIYWLGILSLALVSKSPDTESFSVYSIYIALMGATMFTALFEAQARYIFIWAPLYILAMCRFKDYS